MNILTIESSTDIELLSVESEGRVFQFVENTGLSHSTMMFEHLEKLLKEAGLSMQDISLIGAGTGPGSFTGIRIAVSTARMFSQILSVPLVGVRSHEIYAASCGRECETTVAVAFDAKKSRIYGGLYRLHSDNAIETMCEPGDFTVREFMERFPEQSTVTCIGDGFVKFRNEVTDYAAGNNIMLNIIEGFMPSGEAASRLVREKYSASPEKYSNYSGTLPSYERPSDAEAALNKK